MADQEERETHQVDGKFVDAHLEGVAMQFRDNNFVDEIGAFTNLEYFVRLYYPELANHEHHIAEFWKTEEGVQEWARRFGPVGYSQTIPDADGYTWTARCGGGTPVYATTFKGVIVLSVIQAFQDMFHATKTGPRLELVK